MPTVYDANLPVPFDNQAFEDQDPARSNDVFVTDATGFPLVETTTYLDPDVFFKHALFVGRVAADVDAIPKSYRGVRRQTSEDLRREAIKNAREARRRAVLRRMIGETVPTQAELDAMERSRRAALEPPDPGPRVLELLTVQSEGGRRLRLTGSREPITHRKVFKTPFL